MLPSFKYRAHEYYRCSPRTLNLPRSETRWLPLALHSGWKAPLAKESSVRCETWVKPTLFKQQPPFLLAPAVALLLNEYGKVIGLTTCLRMRDGQNLNFVMSARHITDLMERKNPITLSQMLTETQTTTPVAANTFMVPARNGWKIPLNVSMQQGALLEGSYRSPGGGGGNGCGCGRAHYEDDNRRVVLNSGRVSGSGEIKILLPRGSYFLYFNNQFSTFTSKSVSPDLKLVYYR